MSCGRRHGPSRSMMLVMVTSPIFKVCTINLLLNETAYPLAALSIAASTAANRSATKDRISGRVNT